MADALTQPLPVIPGMKIHGIRIVVDDHLRTHFSNEEEIKAYLHSEFSASAASTIADVLVLWREDNPVYCGDGIMFFTEYGFIPDMKTFNKALRNFLRDYYMEGYTKAVAEFARREIRREEPLAVYLRNDDCSRMDNLPT